MFDLWRTVLSDEMPKLLKMVDTKTIPAGLRTVAIEEAVDERSTVLDIDSARKIFEQAGLVHMMRNNVKDDMFMCNCCSCCCVGFGFFKAVGDPFVFARGGEEAAALAAAGLDYEIIPGITSALGFSGLPR